MERTFVIIKPDAVQRGLIGEIISRYEMRGLKVVAMELRQVDRALAEEHYGEHKGKGFYEGLVAYITSCPVVTLLLEGPKAIEIVRNTNGATNPVAAAPGTIRADFGMTIGRNIVHASDAPESAAREIALWFGNRGISWARDTDAWLIEN